MSKAGGNSKWWELVSLGQALPVLLTELTLVSTKVRMPLGHLPS